MNSADFSNNMKDSCTKYFGTAGIYFVQKFAAALQEEPDGVMQELRDECIAICRELTPEGASPEQARIINRFAAVQLAGTLAANFGILPFSEDEIAESVKYVLNLTLTKTSGIADNDRDVIRLQDFIIRNHAGVPSIRDTNVSAPKCFRDPSKNIYIFTDEQLASASGSNDIVGLAKYLRGKKLLFTNEQNRLKSKHRLACGADSFVRMYAVKADILQAELHVSDRVMSTVNDTGSVIVDDSDASSDDDI